MKRLIFSFFCLAVLLSCHKSPTNSNQAIPTVSVYTVLYLSDPLYSKLNFNNNYVYLTNIGVKGIIVSNVGGNYFALERNCPYNPLDACATVTVESGGITIACGSYDSKNKWTPCCGSKFQLDGTLISGPARYSLKRYAATLSSDGTSLTITN